MADDISRLLRLRDEEQVTPAPEETRDEVLRTLAAPRGATFGERFRQGAREESERGRLEAAQAQVAVKRETSENDPTSEVSKRAQNFAIGVFGAGMDPSDLEFIRGTSYKDFKEFGLFKTLENMATAKAAAAAKANAAEAVSGREAGRGKRFDEALEAKKRNEIRSTVLRVVGQDLPEMRELRKNIRSAKSLLYQVNLSVDNPIARSSLGFLAARVSGSNSQLSDAEREVFIKAGGALDKAAQAWQNIKDGTLIPDMAKHYKAWLAVMSQRAEQQLRAQEAVQKIKIQSLYGKDELKDINLDDFVRSLSSEETPVAPQAPSGLSPEARRARIQELKAKLGK